MVPVSLLFVTPILVVGKDFKPICGVLGLAAVSRGSLATLLIIVQEPTTWAFLSIHTYLAQAVMASHLPGTGCDGFCPFVDAHGWAEALFSVCTSTAVPLASLF